MSDLRVVLHAPTPDALQRARSNALNLLAAEPLATIEIVVNASGARAALEDPHQETTALLRVCENSLAKQDLTAPDDMVMVKAAILHLAERQQEGWAYIRA